MNPINSPDPDKLDPAEEAGLADLRNEAAPPALEGRITKELESRGLLKPQPTGAAGYRWLLALAAVALLTFGYGLGRITSTQGAALTASTGGPAWGLFLRGGDPPKDPADLELRVAAMSAWLQDLRLTGVHIDGEHLERQAWWVDSAGGTSEPRQPPPGPNQAPDGGRLTGFLIVDGVAQPQALEIAASAPFLSFGGRIEVRAIGR